MIPRATLKQLEFDKILGEIASRTNSDVSAQTVLALEPYSTVAPIEARSGRIREIRALGSLGIALRIGRFDDIRPLLNALRPAGAFLSPHELLLFIPVLRILRDLERQFVPRQDIPLLQSLDPQPRSFADILEPLEATVDHDGSIMDSASSDLREIRRAKRSLAARIRKKIEEIVRDNNIEIFLQDDFITQRSGRWVIPVRMDSKGMVKGVVHDVSSSGETAFMEPLEIIPFVNELENLAAEEKAEEIRILRQLSAWIREDAVEIGPCFDSLVTLDVLNAMARFANDYDLEQAQVNLQGRLRLHGARHPLLLMLQRQGALSRVEPLDLRLGAGDEGEAGPSVMVITGPNAGGKTIALKTAGVLTLMALCGMPLPVDGARSTVSLVDTLLVDIGDEQSIEESLSTFSAHVARITAILEQAGPRALVLLDEMGAGTEPQQGAAIACAVLHDLEERGATVIATTHLSEIIGFVHRAPGMINAGVEFDAERFTPLYRLVVGEPGHSHAIEIARRFGLPERVIATAREMLGSAGGEFTSLLAELHRKREELDEARAELERRQARLAEAQAEVEQRAAGIERARREVREKAWEEAREVISTSRRRMNELLEEYKRERRSESIEKLRQVEHEVAERLEPLPAPADDRLPLKEVRAGDRVHVRSLGHDGQVLQVMPKQRKARVRAGSMELDVALDDLSAPAPKGRKPSPEPRGTWQVSAVETEQHEIKLIGMRVEEALELLDRFLNHASLSGLREIRIIHGLGSGRLRQAVREYLQRHPLVVDFRSGEAHEGREGATVAALR